MKKNEIIWRYILSEGLAKNLKARPQPIFTQKDIAKKFNCSTSTVFNALKIPRKMGAIEVTGRFFRLRDAEKLLLLWATRRSLKKDIIYETSVDLPVRSIESSMPPDIIFGAFSAYRLFYDDAPADYSTVYVYSKHIDEIKKRFPPKKGISNLFVVNPDPFLADFGKATPPVQMYVDLWNLREWYAKDFLRALREKFNF